MLRQNINYRNQNNIDNKVIGSSSNTTSWNTNSVIYASEDANTAILVVLLKGVGDQYASITNITSNIEVPVPLFENMGWYDVASTQHDGVVCGYVKRNARCSVYVLSDVKENDYVNISTNGYCYETYAQLVKLN